jgi:hypothetical protein
MTGTPSTHAGPARAAGPASPPINCQIAIDKIGVPVSTTQCLSSVPADGTRVSRLVSAPGIVAGTVLRAARLSARLARQELADAVGADEATIAAWEDGIEPLADVPYPVFGRLEAALSADAERGLVTDLTVAVWCDLVIAAVANAQDVGCLMADPTAAGEAFGELLAWSVGWHRPTRYHAFIGPGPLLRLADVALLAGSIRKLGQAHRFSQQRAA